MPCRCGEERRVERAHAFRRTVAGCTFAAEVNVDACAGCDEPNVPAALVIAFERAVALELARRGPVSGETFRWIRKAAALERTELAQLLGVSVETIASWEEERRSPDAAAWVVVASIALDAVDGPRPLRSRMKSWRRAGRAVTPPQVTSVALDTHLPASVGRVLDLLASSVALTDTEIADALDVDVAALRSRLRELAERGLVSSVEAPDTGAVRWLATCRDRRELAAAAVRAGVDVDVTLPRPKRSFDSRTTTLRARPSAVSWRAV